MSCHWGQGVVSRVDNPLIFLAEFFCGCLIHNGPEICPGQQHLEQRTALVTQSMGGVLVDSQFL